MIALLGLRRILQVTLLSLIRIYQYALSPFFGPCCRFTPSCSSYAILCVNRFGPAKGAWLALKRILRCHPFHPGGDDPVPLKLGE